MKKVLIFLIIALIPLSMSAQDEANISPNEVFLQDDLSSLGVTDIEYHEDDHDEDVMAEDPLAQYDLLYQYDWVIEAFETTYYLEQDSSIRVDERIAVDFFQERRGIIREIPTRYKNDQGILYNLKLKLESVTDEKGVPWSIADQRKADPFYLQIGEVDKYLTGVQVYDIKYSAQRGIRFFKDHDELYWNVFGADSEVPILTSRATVVLPEEVDASLIILKCYTGPYGTEQSDCSYRFINNNTIQFETDRVLNDEEYEAFTIAVSLPKGVISEPSQLQKIGWLVRDNWGIGLPLLIFLIFWILWMRYGNDDDLKKTIIAQYEAPAQMSPLITDILIHDRSYRSSSLAAEIVYLAVKKQLKIKEIYGDKGSKIKDYQLIRLKKADSDLTDYQKELIKALFNDKGEVKLSSLKNKFYKELPKIKAETESHLNKYYHLKPWIAVFYVFVAIAVLGGSILGGISYDLRADLIVGGIMSSVIIYIFGIFMPKKTKHGLDTLWQIKGLKHFIKVAEKYRVKFYEEENMFEKVLPFAMVFGLADKWAKVFEDIFKEPPDWFESTHSFNTAYLVSSLSDFKTTSASSMTSRPSSSGSGTGSFSSSGFSGGFSGGGFGGGGVGSW